MRKWSCALPSSKHSAIIAHNVKYYFRRAFHHADAACRTRLNEHRRLKALDQCLQQVEVAKTRGNKELSAAKAACVECDVVIKMHQQLLGDKLLPMRLERSDLDAILKRSEYAFTVTMFSYVRVSCR